MMRISVMAELRVLGGVRQGQHVNLPGFYYN